MKWTDAQQKAIDSRKPRIIVSASAGSGKTSVMIERIVGLLAEGNSLENMLIVTFTRAAAADMKDKLAARLAAAPLPHLKAELKQLALADIGTLHSWCQKLISRYFYATRLDPDFSVMEESEKTSVLFECIDKVVDDFYEKNDADFVGLAQVLATRGDENLKQALADFYFKLSVRPDFSLDISEDGCRQALEKMLEDRRQILIKSAKNLYFDTSAAGFTRNIQPAYSLWQQIEQSQNITAVAYGKIPPEFTSLNDSFKAIKASAKDLEDFQAEVSAAKSGSTAYLKVLTDMANQLETEFSAAKRALSKSDFSDLEHYAHDILNSDAIQEIRSHYTHVFVDEYQDINPLQNSIVDCLDAKNLFLVGDLKQSIYAFRGCEPRIFAQKIKDFSGREDSEVIELNANHRSKIEILGFADQVFSSIMTEEFGGSDYQNSGRFLSAPTTQTQDVQNENETKPVNLYIYDRQKQVREGVYNLENHGSHEDDQVASLVLSRITELLGTPIPIREKNKTHDKNTAHEKTRPCTLKDIAVLVRGSSPSVTALMEMLDAFGLAYHSPSLNAASRPHIDAFVCYLKLIDNRLSDPTLINALKSHFGGFTDDELAQIRMAFPKAETFVAATDLFVNHKADTDSRSSKTDENSGFCSKLLQQKLKLFFEKLDVYRQKSTHESLDKLLGGIVTDFSYFQKMFAASADSAAALDSFLALASKHTDKSLSQFLLQKAQNPPAAGADALTITTVHLSKGLEFEFVIIMDAHRPFNQKDLSKNIIFSQDMAAIKHFDWETHTALPSVGWLLAKERLKKHQKEEEMRLLYVAITRAKLGLDIFAECSESSSESCQADEKNAGEGASWLDWLLPFAKKHQKPLPAPAALKSSHPHTHTQTHSHAPSPTLIEKIQRNLEFTPQKNPLSHKTYVTALLENHPDTADSHIVYAAGESDDRAALIGTLYHKAMEKIDFYQEFDTQWQSLDDEIKNFVNKAQIQKATQILAPFLEDYQVYKEQAFILDLPAESAGMGSEGSVLVQGIIDLIALPKNTTKPAIIIDFKTGNLSPKYKIQLDLYKTAAEKILKIKVEKTLVYSFKSAKLIDSNSL